MLGATLASAGAWAPVVLAAGWVDDPVAAYLTGLLLSWLVLPHFLGPVGLRLWSPLYWGLAWHAAWGRHVVPRAKLNREL